MKIPARFARVGVIPEMNHNESVAWGGVGNDRDPSVEDNVVLFLRRMECIAE